MRPRIPTDWAKAPLGLLRDPHLRRTGRWIGYSAMIGVVSGVGAIVFDLIFRAAQWGLLGKIGRFLPPSAGAEGGAGFPPQAPSLLPVALVAGGLISGLLVYSLAPEAEGHGTDAVIDAFHRKMGKIRRRVPLVKMVASAITIGAGGSGGREGPIAQIGAGFGAFLGDVLKLTNRERRIMTMAGVAGGIGAIFRAPLGATFFAAEVLYSSADFEYEVLIPGLISSITSYSVFSSYAGWGLMFNVPPLSFDRPGQLVFYAALGLLCAVVGAVYPKFFYGVRDRVFRPLRAPLWIKPALGALALGVVAVFFPQVLGMGYGYVQQAMHGQFTAGFLITFALLKIVATTLTISSGGSGGVFGPSVVIGGALGGAFGTVAAQQFPGVAPEPAACIMVGMGGFFAGVAKVPFASVIMVMEMTGSYGLLVPSLLVAAIAYLLLPQTIRLYENQVPGRVDSPVHQGSFAVDVLKRIRLRDIWDSGGGAIRTVREELPLKELVNVASSAAQGVYPVVDRDGRLAGEVSVEDIRRVFLADRSPDRLTARDVAHPIPEPLTPADDLAYVARRLADHHADALTVVRDRETRQVIGVFGRRDLIVAYGRRLETARDGDEGEDRGARR